MSRAVKPRSRRSAKKNHEFVLIYSGADELTQELEDAIYEAGCSDALLGIQNGVVFLAFHRQAPSFRIALTSAIADVEKAGVALELLRVESA